LFEKEIIIRIPNRFSLYNDFGKVSKFSVEDGGWVEFKVKGMLITPPDGQVYYTSDVDSFVSDSAKVSGHYFYVDSDLNGFYETVYILNDYFYMDTSDTPVYTVMSIGLNYDGIHDFAPYERLYDRELVVSNFETSTQESVMFGSDWIYNFRHLKDEELLKETVSKLEECNLKPKDQIFEIYKLVQMSEQNSEFSELFYEIRHKTYSTAWEQYKEQLIGDIAEQVFMSVTASLLSATVEAILTGATFGFGYPAAKAASVLTYMGVYTLMTKFYVDIDLAKAEAEKRSQTFYSVSSDNREPSSLNERNLLDRVLGDSMAAALIGHPGGYYAEVSGGEPGNMYTGQLLVSPPNLLRMWYSFDGFLDLLWENFWSMGESDPDAYAALDFDDINLDYFLLTSELPSYNQDPYYTYENADGIFDLYNMYALNTLGYLETQISQASGGQYDAIRATCIDGRPQYEFINSTLYQAVTPQSVLYRPIVLSQERYDQLQPAPGSLVVKARCKDYENTIGIDPYAMSDVEREVYAAKVPLNDNGFEYPIREISIDVVKYNVYTGFSYFVKGLIVNESDYSIDLGNLYFNKSIEELVSEKSSGFEDFLSYALAHEIIESKIYFNVRIVFDVFVPDTTEESSRLALAQATSHAIMDYFNQYVFAEVSANSISEITYTETMTFWSTLISAPLVYFGSWAVKGTDKMLGKASIELIKAGEITRGQAIKQMLLQSFASMALSPIKEVFQEIIEDGFIEAVAENFADMLGWTEDAGFWLSSFFTSVRETTGALGQLALGDAGVAFGDANLKTKLSLISARISGDANAIAEITASVQQNVEQKQADAEAKRQQMNSWQKVISSGFFKGLLMVLPAVLYGSFSFAALKGINNMIESTESAVPKAYARYRSEVQAYRKGKLIEWVGTQDALINNLQEYMKWVGTQDALINNLQEYMKKPAELEAAKPEVNEKYKATQNTEKYNPSLTAFLSSLNSNPKSTQAHRTELFNTFKNIDSSHLPSSVGLDTFKDQMVTKELQDTVSNQKAVKRMAEWKQELHESIEAQKESSGLGLFETYYPAKEMTIMDMLTELKLDRARQMWSILVNGEKVDSDYFIITPSDDVKIILRFAGASDTSGGDAVKGMISSLEITIIDSLIDTQNKIDSYLTQDAIDLIVNSWRDAKGPLHTKANFDSEKGPNRNVAHFALFRYLMLDKLMKCGIITSGSYSDLYKISGNMRKSLDLLKLSTEDSEFRFVPTHNALALYHARINLELYSKLRGQSLLDVLAEIDELFSLQYKIYGYNMKNPFYIKALETFYGWADILGSEKYGEILTFERAPSLSKLSEFYGRSRKFSDVLRGLKKYDDIHPERDGNIEEYLNTIKDVINSKIKSNAIKLSQATKSELFKDLETFKRLFI
jgi:hypothetical protein